MDKIKLTEEFYSLLDKNDVEKMLTYVTENFTIDIGFGSLGLEILKGMGDTFQKTFENPKHNLSELKEENGDIVGKMCFTGKHIGALQLPGMPPIPATNKDLKSPDFPFTTKFDGDKISSVKFGTVDGSNLMTSLMQQITSG